MRHETQGRHLFKPLLLVALATVCGFCSTAHAITDKQRKWLSIFFDGVPPKGVTNQTHKAHSPATNGPAQFTPAAPAPRYEPEIHAHPPFVQHECSQCHESKSGEGMRMKPPDMCFQCHKNFLANKKDKHQPVESGECVSCHDPHQSPNKNLLLKTGKALCFDCHDNFLEKAKVKHQPAENGDCIACHNPHASDQKALVTKKIPGLCWDCHDNFLAKAKFTHDPVETCTTCHNPHQSAQGALLVKGTDKLCFDCHEEKDLRADAGHANMAGKSCVTCHDPHVGSDKNLLKPSARSAAATPH